LVAPLAANIAISRSLWVRLCVQSGAEFGARGDGSAGALDEPLHQRFSNPDMSRLDDLDDLNQCLLHPKMRDSIRRSLHPAPQWLARSLGFELVATHPNPVFAP
jgi:hypothetical protein